MKNLELDKRQKKLLLGIARETIENTVTGAPPFEYNIEDPVLNTECGAFVTIHHLGNLRGCIGNITASTPLWVTVMNMAVEASIRDPRFPPVTTSELDDIDIEISALSPMRKIDDYNEIKIPGQGVMVRMGFRSGVYLPQVATETGWDREEFMNSLCAHKAGIPMDAWKTGECEIYVFDAEVFGEKEKQ